MSLKYFLLLTLFLVFHNQIKCEKPKRYVSKVLRGIIFGKKCMDELGCFENNSPYFDITERPLSLLPEERDAIGTHFLLYTPTDPNTPHLISNKNFSSDIEHSGFNPNLKTKFIVPGYMSKEANDWITPMKDKLLEAEECNVLTVDWSGGNGLLYEQAVSNTRVVGAEIARLIELLRDNRYLHAESVHIIGHSLGAHIAGYAGKRIPRLGRITGLDPAGPYFTNVDPVVRLDRGDALFVDVIHTNSAPNRFFGFGITENIGHFDFYPNGGHLQPGCKDMGEAILTFFTHPTLDYDHLHEIMCNHARAVELFASSIHNNGCRLKGVLCDNWENFIGEKCGHCDPESDQCATMGMHADENSSIITPTRSLDFYLNTTDTAPFC